MTSLRKLAFSATSSLALMLSLQLTAIADENSPILDPLVTGFVDKFCGECHNDFIEEGDRSFDSFLLDPNSDTQHLTIEEMLDQLNLGKMPEQRKGVLQPTADERRAAVTAMTEYLTKVTASEVPNETPLRRLTNTEYSNTMRDLLGVVPEKSEAFVKFLPDTNVHGFENLGHAQTLSQAQLHSYIKAAGEYLDFSFENKDKPLPEPVRYEFGPRDFIQGNQRPARVNQVPQVISKDGSYLDIFAGRPTAQRPNFPLNYIASGGAPADGLYVLRFKAEGINRYFAYGAKNNTKSNAKAIKLGIGIAPNPEAIDVVHASERKLIQYFDLPDDGAQDFEITIPMQKGNVPFFYWPYGRGGGSFSIKTTIRDHLPQYKKKLLKQRADGRYDVATQRGKAGPALLKFMREEYQAPRLRLHKMEIAGPFPHTIPGALDAKAFNALSTTAKTDMESALVTFASKAFRRPTSTSEIQPYIDYTNAKLEEGNSEEKALKLGYTALLSSPKFLYLAEGNSEESKYLDQYELASRLSYFIWSSMPDQTLLDLAETGELSNPEILSTQVKRMLLDEKALAFVEGFTKSWLRLDLLGKMPPDPQIYAGYYNNRLEAAMRKETELLFYNVLLRNESPLRFIDADYTFVNDALAAHYGLKGEFGEVFQRVKLPKNSRRRGITGHASILTASANGVETSPVVRGVWILENLLGTPPSPAPPDVPAIEPDTRGAKTVRELIAKHRSVQACADCHAHIDPYGFPLEIYGPIGETRNRYPTVVDGDVKLNRGALIDASAELATGETIKTLDDFHEILLQKQGSFEINLMSQLLTYGTGREPTFRDRPEIEKLIAQLKAEDAGFMDMVTLAVTSEYFKSR